MKKVQIKIKDSFCVRCFVIFIVMLIFVIASISILLFCINIEKQSELKTINIKHSKQIATLKSDIEKCKTAQLDALELKIERMKNYILWQKPSIKEYTAETIAKAVVITSAQHRINPSLVIGLIAVESSYDEKALSNAEAYGLLQVRFPVWKETFNIKNLEDLYDIRYNILIGVQILKHYITIHNNDISRALQAYNGSKGQKFPNKVFFGRR